MDINVPRYVNVFLKRKWDYLTLPQNVPFRKCFKEKYDLQQGNESKYVKFLCQFLSLWEVKAVQ